VPCTPDVGTRLSLAQRSKLFALIPDLQLELPALAGHQHPAKFVPRNLSSIDNEQRCVTPLGVIPLDRAQEVSLLA
jgi:hypothetical protein